VYYAAARMSQECSKNKSLTMAPWSLTAMLRTVVMAKKNKNQKT